MKIARVFAVAALLAFLGACAHPPQAEIDAARAALDAASRNADVITYAPDSLRRAQEKMDALDAEIALQAKRSGLSRNYDAAAVLAKEAADLSVRAGTESLEAKRHVADDAAGLVDAVTAAIPTFESTNAARSQPTLPSSRTAIRQAASTSSSCRSSRHVTCRSPVRPTRYVA